MSRASCTSPSTSAIPVGAGGEISPWTAQAIARNPPKFDAIEVSDGMDVRFDRIEMLVDIMSRCDLSVDQREMLNDLICLEVRGLRILAARADQLMDLRGATSRRTGTPSTVAASA